MTGAEHYREAERLLDRVDDAETAHDAEIIMQAAQVHATLATAAAIAEMDVYPGGESSAATGRSEKRAKAWAEVMAP